ncbi:MAG: cytochrome c oxidase subunit II [Gammaproteobacteria bacterium]|nr:cytochrome c oxidase subunit II [Gammaproteobacteria bacterium]
MNPDAFDDIGAFTTEASNHATHIDTILFALTAISLLIATLVIILIVGFSIRYRRGARPSRGPLPKVLRRELEVSWTMATLLLFLFVFWWAASAQLSSLQPPADGLRIQVMAKQWMWRIRHPNGAREINVLHVPVNRPVTLVMTSQDVIHSLYLPALRIKQDVLPRRYTRLWFTARKTGAFALLCAEFCGTAHSRMTGRIVVMKPAAYARWMAAQPQTIELAQAGADLFRSLGCSGCHAAQSAVHAPPLRGVFNRLVLLEDGRSVRADEAYLRDAILRPRRDIVAGYAPIMPGFRELVDEAELFQLIAYLKSLALEPESGP